MMAAALLIPVGTALALDLDKDVSVVYSEAASKANTTAIVYLGQFKTAVECEAAAATASKATAFSFFDPAFNHADAKWASGCYARIDGKYPVTKKGLVTSGHIGSPPVPTPVPPAPTPQPPPPPTPPGALVRTAVVAPGGGKAYACGARPQGAAVNGVFYFLPAPGGAASLATYTLATKAWGAVPIPSTVPVMKMLSGASMVGVAAAVAGVDDFVVVSGGKSKNVISFNVQKKAWETHAAMTNSQSNACSASCRGYWFSMTGDFAKSEGATAPANATVGARRRLKPANRQVYRYNLTSGEHFENNGEKQRGGAGCGCDAAANRVFWAGGFSDSGVTSDVEYWGADPLHRGGEPQRSTAGKRRDVGGVACGGLFVAAGGNDGGTPANTLDMWVANDPTASGKGVTLKMPAAINAPVVGCVDERYITISGGINGKACNTQVFWLDTQNVPTAGTTIAAFNSTLAGVTGDVARATDEASGTVMFFDGVAGELIST